MEPARFACDLMLGKLARWLRLAGFDTAFDPYTSRPALVGLAREQGRWLLSRSQALIARAGPRALWLRSTSLAGQIGELRLRLGIELDQTRLWRRCSRCNGVVDEVARAEVVERVPPFVAVHAPRFFRCAQCQHVYWPGSHCGRIVRRLAALFEVKPPPAT